MFKCYIRVARYTVPRESNCANVLLVFIRPHNFFRKVITFSQLVISKVYCLWQESILADFCFRKGFKLLKFLQKNCVANTLTMFDWFLTKLEKNALYIEGLVAIIRFGEGLLPLTLLLLTISIF